MSGNTFGQVFRISTFGESHGVAIGGVIDGCPAGLVIDENFVQSELDRRRPGQSAIVTQRDESDSVEFLSGIFEGKSTGSPIGFLIRNSDQKSADYEHLRTVYRPSHADYTWSSKFGLRDHRGGGRASARETAARVVGGAIAKLFLRFHGIEVRAYVSQVGQVILQKNYKELDLSLVEDNPVRCPEPRVASTMEQLIREVRKDGDTIGGVVSCVIAGVPVGIGEPVFDRLHADLAKATMSINAAKAFEYGSGFSGVTMRGSEHNDPFVMNEGKVHTSSNWSGGIQGGISNGEDIFFRVAFKPVATIMKEQASVDSEGNAAKVSGKGRHDPCVVPRAVPIVESMAALVIADHILRQRSARL